MASLQCIFQFNAFWSVHELVKPHYSGCLWFKWIGHFKVVIRFINTNCSSCSVDVCVWIVIVWLSLSTSILSPLVYYRTYGFRDTWHASVQFVIVMLMQTNKWNDFSFFSFGSLPCFSFFFKIIVWIDVTESIDDKVLNVCFILVFFGLFYMVLS